MPGVAQGWLAWAQARPIVVAAAVIAIGGAATILGAWFFEYGLGLRPCPLCLEQRHPYYFAIPLAVFILLGESVGSRRRILMAGFAAIAALMLWNAGLGAYHAGVEWKWWAGPNTCGGAADLAGSGSLLDQLQSINVVRCDEIPWSFLGLSLAGYNVLISLTLAGVALWGLFAGLKLPARQEP
ncbi:MAG: disulfide bond formation protein B [Hyphomicrobiales bacterium]|nr:disulfide bond formation protein B [Hyphomicrobiales bacterium]